VGHFRRRAARGASGALVNVGSALSDRAIPLQGMYCATKHAVKAFTEALRMELEEEGVPVSVSLVKPASVDTPFYDHARNYMDVAPKPIPPVYEPEDVARAILSCAERPRRDVQVGGAAKALAASTAAPRLTDRVMEARLFDAQRDPEGRADGRSAGNLWEPADPATERGHQGGRAVRARPLRHLAAIVAAGVGVALVASARPAGERARE
jgi:hypothetical protein